MRRSWLLAGCLLAWLTPASASPPAETFTHASLIAETRSVQPGKPLSVALRLESKDGWHTYWRYPGDTGLATKIAWRLPNGFRAGDIEWPAPERIEIGPAANYGYHGEVLLLTKIDVPAAASALKTVTLNAQADWLACEKICVPESATLTLTLPVSDAAPEKDARWQEKFSAARRQIPVPAPWPATFGVHGDVLALSLPATASDGAQNILFFPHEYGAIDNAAPQAFGLHRDRAVLKMTRGEMMTEQVKHLAGTVVMVFKSGGGTVLKSFDITASRNDRTL
ncbi:MAG: protein-disulfide reductase DsbD domain-containing protein [Rhodospirillales bacterium]